MATFRADDALLAYYGRTTDDTRRVLSASGTELWLRIYGDSLQFNHSAGTTSPVYVSYDGGAWSQPAVFTNTTGNALSGNVISGASDAWHDVKIRANGPEYVKFRLTDGIVVTSSGGTAQLAAHTDKGTYERVNGTYISTYGLSTFHNVDATATALGFTSPGFADSRTLNSPTMCLGRNALCEFNVASDVTKIWLFVKQETGNFSLWVDGVLRSSHATASGSGSYGMVGPYDVPGSGQRRVAITNLRRLDAVMVNGSGFPSVAVTVPTKTVAWFGDSITAGDSATSQADASYNWDQIAFHRHRSFKSYNRGISGDFLAGSTDSGRAMVSIQTSSTITGLTKGETITQASTGATARVSYVIATANRVIVDNVTGSPNNSNNWTGGTSAVVFTPTTAPTGQDRVRKDLAPLSADIIVFNMGVNDAASANTDAKNTTAYYKAALTQLIDLTSARILVIPQAPYASTYRTQMLECISDAVTAVNDARITYYGSDSFASAPDRAGSHPYPAGMTTLSGQDFAAVRLTGQPSDGDTVTITGTDTAAVVFEFDNNASVTGGRTAVTIGADIAATTANLFSAIDAASTVFNPIHAVSLSAASRYGVDLYGVSSLAKSGANITVYSPEADGFVEALQSLAASVAPLAFRHYRRISGE